MTDIIERLRRHGDALPRQWTFDVMREAADEIERLRLENKLLFDNIKGNNADLERFNRALRTRANHG
jgi:hypothetical protein